MVPDVAPRGHSFNGAFAYYLHDKRQDGDERQPQTADRVAWVETRNLMTDDPDDARRIMIATAQQSDALKKAAGVKTSGRKSNQHVYAYSLAWHPDEAGSIDKAEMLKAVDASLKALKADHLQGVVVCHTDQKHPHVHVVLNRVDPADGRMHGFKNDRLQLSDWANQYERERGHIVTPAREDKRQLREQHADKQARQDYARQKRAEASARPRGDLSPAALLKDLGDAQKDRHRQEWRSLSADNKAKRNAIYDDYRNRIHAAAQQHRAEVKPIWAAHFREERTRKDNFNKCEGDLLGVVKNAMAATAYQHMKGEIDGKGKLSATFSNTLSSQNRRAAFEGRLSMDKAALRTELKSILDNDIQGLKNARTAALKGQRQSFGQSRAELVTKHAHERDKVKQAWQQLRADRYRPNAPWKPHKDHEPMKREFDSAKRPVQPEPKRQPTRQATVSTPSPAPVPKGEVPRSTAKRQEVPKGKDWSKTPTQASPRGLSGTAPARKDWSKTGASKAPVTPPKDWSKKAERSSEIKKAPSPRRDMDLSLIHI